MNLNIRLFRDEDLDAIVQRPLNHGYADDVANRMPNSGMAGTPVSLRVVWADPPCI